MTPIMVPDLHAAVAPTCCALGAASSLAVAADVAACLAQLLDARAPAANVVR